MEIIKILKHSFLFSGIDESTLAEIIKDSPPKVATFKRGEEVYSLTSGEGMVGFVMSGRCEIRLDRCGSRTVLNILGVGDSFGVLSVYSAEEYPTKIYATKNSEIIFFDGYQIRDFVNNYSQISQNLIKFLAGRIAFLNKKIATFSPSRVTDRLAVFLLCERERQGTDELSFNCQKTAEEIGAGRASVYRAIETLEDQDLIKSSDKKIIIIDRGGLERITK